VAAQRKTYSAQRRKAIGEGVSRRHRENWEEDSPLPESKRCSRCRKFKKAETFGITKRKLKSGVVSRSLNAWCKACAALAEKERKQRLEAKGVDVKARKREQDRRWRANLSPAKLAALREREREWQAITRRKNGHGAYGARRGAQENNEGDRLPPGPLVDFLEAKLGSDTEGIGMLAHRSGIAQRRIYGLLHGEYEKVALSTIDKLLLGLGAPHMLAILYPEA
jgi:hypothetical protein